MELNSVYDERGLLGLAFHPDFATNGRFFVYFDAIRSPDSPAGFDADVVLAEFAVSAEDANIAETESGRELLRVPHPQFNHQGGQLAFGPDGYLYISIGDGGGGGDTGTGHNAALGNAQDKSSLLGKVLRIDVDGNEPYAIPADNPFVDDPNARPEIWAYGFRNPWRFSFDQKGARRLFLADVGQNLFEEVDIVTAGGNYGWRIREGFSCFNVASQGDPLPDCVDVGVDGAPLTEPILALGHDDASGRPQNTSVIGGFIHHGQNAALQGDYVFGDYTATGLGADGRLYAAREQADGSWVQRDLAVNGAENGRLGRFLFAFGQDLKGEVYVLTSRSFGPSGTTGEVFRLDAVAERTD